MGIWGLKFIGDLGPITRLLAAYNQTEMRPVEFSVLSFQIMLELLLDLTKTRCFNAGGVGVRSH